ncbi:MAG: helix-turn-helix domain-containing protein [Clostridia bacterium]|nr:helix-turn-helix domain-containing protein [Clostridia bacterium]
MPDNEPIRKLRKNEFIESGEAITLQHTVTKTPYMEHKHDFVELVYIMSGKIRQRVDGEDYILTRGDMLIVNYNQSHSFEPLSRAEYVNIMINPEFFSNTLINSENMYEIFEISMFSEFSPGDITYTKPYVAFEGDEMLRIEEIISHMLREFLDKKSGYKSVISGYMRVLFSLLLRKMCSKTDSSHSLRHVTRELIEYIDVNFGSRITLEELAERCFYNTSYLSRMFKKQSGITVSEYIRKKRMENAARLLKSCPDMSIAAIMEQCGYTDTKLFYGHFKEYYMVSPKDYRKKNSNNKVVDDISLF